MKKILLFAYIFLLLAFPCHADRIGVLVEEIDGSPAGYAYKLKITNGALSLTGGVGTITVSGSDLTEEQVEDYVGGMLGGTETLISVTYQDETGDIDFVVDSDLHKYSWTNVVAGDLPDLSAVYQSAHASLASIAGLTEAAGSIIYCTADNTYAVLGEGSNDGYVLAINTATHTPYWKQDADSGGATALDDIGDPDAATLISMDDNESLTLSSAEDTGTVMIITNTDADLSGATSMLDLKYTDDGSANGYFLRGYDNSGNDLKFYIGADGTADFGAITCSSVTADPIASPYSVLRDSDGAGADNADKEAAKWYAQMSTTTEDGEVSDFRLTSFGAGAAGTEYTNEWFDSSDAAIYFGVMSNADTPAEVADYEYIKLDFNTATDAEIAISSVATLLNYGTLNRHGTGTIQGRTLWGSDITENTSLSAATDFNKAYLVTAACTVTLAAASTAGYGATVMFYVRDASETVIIEIDNADKICLDGTALDAGDTIDSPGAAGDFITLIATTDADGSGTDGWRTLGRSGKWTDGGAS